ncbi:MAG: hypothetical protein SCARUB_00034 [Candidatus Scalindua rubra]|uniref:Uncharacterized protein n=1 Tax=Candidatus Scalindua rubra TaxID=1872076 RepID=A0A1E3XIN9_9BACT|nr:MAG: hypothetical protein SCARUB_00034 [Candidatus Scalindua rubra]
MKSDLTFITVVRELEEGGLPKQTKKTVLQELNS